MPLRKFDAGSSSKHGIATIQGGEVELGEQRPGKADQTNGDQRYQSTTGSAIDCERAAQSKSLF